MLIAYSLAGSFKDSAPAGAPVRTRVFFAPSDIRYLCLVCAQIRFPYRELDLSLFSPFQPGTLWGANGEKGYFHLRFTLPADMSGREVRLLLHTGGEGLCFRDGQPWQGVDWAHPEVL